MTEENPTPADHLTTFAPCQHVHTAWFALPGGEDLRLPVVGYYVDYTREFDSSRPEPHPEAAVLTTAGWMARLTDIPAAEACVFIGLYPKGHDVTATASPRTRAQYRAAHKAVNAR